MRFLIVILNLAMIRLLFAQDVMDSSLDSIIRVSTSALKDESITHSTEMLPESLDIIGIVDLKESVVKDISDESTNFFHGHYEIIKKLIQNLTAPLPIEMFSLGSICQDTIMSRILLVLT
jgi:ferritin-like protein